MALNTKSSLILPQDVHRDPSFSRTYHLIVTTTRGVFSWDSDGTTLLFRSGSAGIVAAKRATNGSNILAVADGQVVILYDPEKGVQKRSYRLKGSDVGDMGGLAWKVAADEVSGPRSIITNAVQSYSLGESRVFSASPTHPSPPNVFAASTSSRLLLSASCRPPTIYLAVSTQRQAPVLLQPQCSFSAAVAANFHPDREYIFALAFSDGTVAVYDAARFIDERGRRAHKIGPEGSANEVEIGYITKVHTTVNHVQGPKTEGSMFQSDGFDPSTGTVGIGELSAGIAAIAFVPGRKALVMTVGADGKCCVVDFAVPKYQTTNSSRIRIVKAWDLGMAGTSLALYNPWDHPPSVRSQERRSGSQDSMDGKVLAAIGLRDSRVLVYDLTGELQGQHKFGSATTRVVGVEWIAADSKFGYRTKIHHKGRPRSKRKGLSSLLATGRVARQRVITKRETHHASTGRLSTAKSSRSGPHPARAQRSDITASTLNRLGLLSKVNAVEPTVVSAPGVLNPTLGHMDIFTPVSSTKSDTTDYQTAKEDFSSSTSLAPVTKQADREAKRNGIIGTDGLNEQSSQSTIVKTTLAPSIPPRPVPKPGGRLFLRRAQTSGINLGSTQGRSNRHSKSLVLMEGTASVRGLKDRSPERPTASSAVPSTNPHDGAWTDIEPESSTGDHETSANKNEGRKGTVMTATPHPSEGSNDTVVDWSANTSLQPAPTMNITRTTTLEAELSVKPASHKKPKRAAPVPYDPTQSSKSDSDTIVQWSSLKKSPRIYDIQNGLQVAPEAITGPASPPPPVPDRAPPSLPPRHSAPMLQSSTAKSASVLNPQAVQQQQSSYPSSNQSGGTNPDSNQELARMLQQSLHRELKLFHRDIMYQFDMQKAWFQRELRDKDVWIANLDDENARLRHELSRMRRR